MASLVNQTQIVKNRQMPFIWNDGCPWRWQPSQDVLVDVGFVHNKAGVLRDTIAGTPYSFKMLRLNYLLVNSF